jgi:hypothetical protein
MIGQRWQRQGGREQKKEEWAASAAERGRSHSAKEREKETLTRAVGG